MRVGGSGKGEGKGGGGGGGGGAAPIHRYTVPSSLPRSAYGVSAYLPPLSAYRRIGVFAPGSAYRRISCPDRRIGVPAYRRISCPDRGIGVSAYRRMCPLRAMRRRIGVSAYRRKAVLRHYLQARWDMCTSLCRAACFLLLHVCRNSFKFCPKRNVLAQVPSVHGRFRSACCLCSTPAARLCAAWELGFSRTRTESAERKTSHRFVIGLGGSLTKSNCGAPQVCSS